MAHTDIIKDSDKCFEIDPITRVIRNASPTKTTIIQFDHNSERFTFTLPRFIEGHDMMECTKAEVHYLNIASSGGEQSAGIYAMTDMAISAEDDSMVTCSWLISQNATKHVGSLNFLIRLSCVAEDGTIEYVWNTEIFKGIMVSTGMYNSEAIVEQYADVLEQWKQELLNANTSATGENFASAIRKTVLGKELTIEDVSPVEHELGVRVLSKNRFCFSGDMDGESYNGLTFSAVAGSSILNIDGTFAATFTGNYNFTTSEMTLPAGVYTMSISGISAGRLNLNKFDEVQKKYVLVTNVSTTAKTFSLDESATIRLQIIVPVGSVYQDESITIQIENGNTATDIVEFGVPEGVVVSVSGGEENQSAVVGSDGYVKGLLSKHPCMNISSDNENVLVECTYSASTESAILKATEKAKGQQTFSMLRLEQGTIDNAGNLATDKTRIRTKDFVHHSNLIVVPDGFNILRVVYYNEQSGGFDSVVIPTQPDGGAVTNYTVGKEGCKAKLVITRSDTTKNLTPEDVQSIRVLNEFGKRISTLEVVSPVEFEYDHNLEDVSAIIDGMDMATSSMMATVYAKMDALMAENPNYISRVDAADLLGLEYPDYASSYKTYMYKLIDTDLPSTGIASMKKKLLLFGGIHGDEPCSMANLYIFAKRLCSDVMNDANLFKLRSSFDIYIVPCVNGYGIMNVTRQNANGININRNYPTSGWFESGAVGDRDYGGATAGSEFETKIVLGLIDEIKPILVIDHHSYGLDGRQFYTGIRGSDNVPYIYRSYLDCSLAFKKGLPQYFGSGFGLVKGFLSTVYSPTMGQLPDWLYEQGYAGGIVESSMCINYNNGEISDVMIDRLGNDTFSVAEYTFRNQILRYAEHALNCKK